MSRIFPALTLLIFCAFPAFPILAQTPAPESSEVLTLSRKIDEQSTKIDALSQQLLKLQQMIEQGKTSAAPTTAGIAPEESATVAPATVAAGNSHVVTRGETLTSIAKQYRVGIEDLQKFNHIENDRKLQIGQTLLIPGPGASAAPSSATPSPNG